MLIAVGSSCPHCEKLIPIINTYDASKYNVLIINLYNAENSSIFDMLIESATYDMDPIKWYPTIIAFDQGRQISVANIHDFSIFDATEELEYRIDTEFIESFFKRYAAYE